MFSWNDLATLRKMVSGRGSAMNRTRVRGRWGSTRREAWMTKPLCNICSWPLFSRPRPNKRHENSLQSISLTYDLSTAISPLDSSVQNTISQTMKMSHFKLLKTCIKTVKTIRNSGLEKATSVMKALSFALKMLTHIPATTVRLEPTVLKSDITHEPAPTHNHT